MKNSNDTIGNRTHNLPVCGEMPQQTALLHAAGTVGMWLNAVGEVLVKQVTDDPCRREA